ncbi:hypothetical protein ACQZV8_14930 [Magnetococcales bacterium HHB-1]
MMNRLNTSFVLGYHGCNREDGEAILQGVPFKPSENDYDWLGHGIYFWEANPQRGIDFARLLSKHPKRAIREIKDPFVIGAIIDLGVFLDLTSSDSIYMVKRAYDSFKLCIKSDRATILKNSGGKDLLKRYLDCAVINHLHIIRKESGILPPIETVRGVFIEGEPLYENAGFYEKTHIQICVRDHSNIKGLFRVPKAHYT